MPPFVEMWVALALQIPYTRRVEYSILHSPNGHVCCVFGSRIGNYLALL